MAILRGADELLGVLRGWSQGKYSNTWPEELVSYYSSYAQDVVKAMKYNFSMGKRIEFAELLAQSLAVSFSESELESKIQSFQDKWIKQVDGLGIFFEEVGDLQNQKRYLDPPYEDALMWAARDGHAEVVEMLLSRMTDEQMSTVDQIGNTFLMLAAKNGHAEVVEMLMLRRPLTRGKSM